MVKVRLLWRETDISRKWAWESMFTAQTTLARQNARFLMQFIIAASIFSRCWGKHPDDMEIDLHIGIPEPSKVDVDVVAKALPYGKVTVKVEKGGLEIPSGDAADPIVIANAGVIVYLNDN
jgi:uncharacterized protein (TIGR02058 family)